MTCDHEYVRKRPNIPENGLNSNPTSLNRELMIFVFPTPCPKAFTGPYLHHCQFVFHSRVELHLVIFDHSHPMDAGRVGGQRRNVAFPQSKIHKLAIKSPLALSNRQRERENQQPKTTHKQSNNPSDSHKSLTRQVRSVDA